MKQIICLLSAAMIALCAVSCEKFLDSSSPSAFNAETIFSNYDFAEGQYFSALQSLGETNSYRGRYLSWIGLNSDIEWYNTYKPTDEKYQIAGYSMRPNNGQLNVGNGPFAKMYESIERLNLCISGIRTYGKPEENADMNYLLSEALTMRAMVYYDLVRAWGDVPARFEPTSSSTIYKAKDSRDIIFKQLLSDLELAIPNLPWPGTDQRTSRTDRVNKMFAQGLYARIALMASGYAIRPDDDMVGTGDLGTVRLSSDPELQKSVLYPKALDYLRDAIGSGKASLEDYEAMWKKQSDLDNLKAGPGYETLYVIPFSDGRGRWNWTFAVRSEGSKYGGGATVKRGGDAGPVPTMWFRYDPKDVRRDITCVNWRWNEKNEKDLPGIQRWYFGKYRFEWMTKKPYTGGNDDGVKPVVLRYADILLMAAEMANELDALDEAKGYLLKVRSRAFKGNVQMAEDYVNAISSKEAMFNAIVDERALEFCGEMTRKFDLIRWNLLKVKMDETIAEMKELRSLSGRFAGINGLDGDVYYQADGDELTIWGFTGETTKPKGVWEKKTGYITKVVSDTGTDTGLYDDLVEHGLYTGDPIQHMYWPIFNDSITNSQGALKNDYGY
ncbi:MAG: RagB/SusD family nutrient uptake outer membrane protein [Bacteroidales bacterium]|nr:RagB/SusD family nutrient uptake outer membrane protein [Bacteroidales bacterium]